MSFALMLSLGITLVYILGKFLNWRWVAVAPIVLIMLFATGMLLVPESPIWLLGHRGGEETRGALGWLRGGGDVTEELQDLEKLHCAINAIYS